MSTESGAPCNDVEGHSGHREYIAVPNDEPRDPGGEGFDRLHEWFVTPDGEFGRRLGVTANAVGVILNVTSVGAPGNGWLTVYPAGRTLPSTSTLNFDSNEYAIANGAVVRPGTAGEVCIHSGQTASQVIFDATGYLLGP